MTIFIDVVVAISALLHLAVYVLLLKIAKQLRDLTRRDENVIADTSGAYMTKAEEAEDQDKAERDLDAGVQNILRYDGGGAGIGIRKEN